MNKISLTIREHDSDEYRQPLCYYDTHVIEKGELAIIFVFKPGNIGKESHLRLSNFRRFAKELQDFQEGKISDFSGNLGSTILSEDMEATYRNISNCMVCEHPIQGSFFCFYNFNPSSESTADIIHPSIHQRCIDTFLDKLSQHIKNSDVSKKMI